MLIWFEFNKYKSKKLEIHSPMVLPDFECIRIRTLHLKLAEYLFAPKRTALEALGLRVNLYSMVTVNK